MCACYPAGSGHRGEPVRLQLLWSIIVLVKLKSIQVIGPNWPADNPGGTCAHHFPFWQELSFLPTYPGTSVYRFAISVQLDWYQLRKWVHPQYDRVTSYGLYTWWKYAANLRWKKYLRLGVKSSDRLLWMNRHHCCFILNHTFIVQPIHNPTLHTVKSFLLTLMCQWMFISNWTFNIICK